MEALLRVRIRTFAVKESLVLCAAVFREVFGGSDEDRGSGDGYISRLRVLASHSCFSVSDHNCYCCNSEEKICFLSFYCFPLQYISPATQPKYSLKAFSVLFVQTDRERLSHQEKLCLPFLSHHGFGPRSNIASRLPEHLFISICD